MALLFEINTWHHVIPFAREFPKQMADNPTWYGYSIGRWEGDTLVVDTRGFNGYTRLDTVGHPHSDALHLTQTFRRLDATTHGVHGDDGRPEDLHQPGPTSARSA